MEKRKILIRLSIIDLVEEKAVPYIALIARTFARVGVEIVFICTFSYKQEEQVRWWLLNQGIPFDDIQFLHPRWRDKPNEEASLEQAKEWAEKIRPDLVYLIIEKYADANAFWLSKGYPSLLRV